MEDGLRRLLLRRGELRGGRVPGTSSFEAVVDIVLELVTSGSIPVVRSRRLRRGSAGVEITAPQGSVSNEDAKGQLASMRMRKVARALYKQDKR